MNGYFWVTGFLVLAVPGLLIGKLLRVRGEDLLVRWALIIAAGMSFWPLLTLWTSIAHFRWTSRTARAFALLLAVAAVLALAIDRRGWHRFVRRLRASWAWYAAFAMLMAATIWTRWAQARGLAFPPWVDAVHHTMIVRLIIDQGLIPHSLSPYIEGGDLYYHVGFHALAAWTAWVSAVRQSMGVIQLLLDYGQMLNALTLLMVYAAARTLLRSRWAALIAAGFATLVSYFPAYYLSWGRYTHLAGILVFPALMTVLWQLARRTDWRTMLMAILLSSGLVLIHVRIAFFAAVFAAELAIILVWKRRWHALGAWAIVAAASFALVSPWLVRVIHDPFARAFITPAATNEGDVHQMLPLDILWAPHNRELLAIATVGMTGIAGWLGMPVAGRIASGGAWLLCVWLARKKNRRGFNPWLPLAVVAIFCATVAVLLEVHHPIDFTRFASVSSALMSLFLPLSIAAAATLLWALQRLFGVARTTTVSLAVLAAIVLSGVFFLHDVVNPATVFTDGDDLRALTWIGGQHWDQARFAVAARPWMGSSWVGSDGGYWISVVTDGRSTLPPLLYAWALPVQRVAVINRVLEESNRPDALTNAGVRSELRAAGVTHFYCGSRDDANRRRTLLESGHARVIHRDGSAAVLEIVW
ncbi:MAG TPA: DUF6541 family protein [Thermoanaerobaculia bacterium]|nr:DUF6541 family protein [Thermoanaerobaculia bacterium]